MATVPVPRHRWALRYARWRSGHGYGTSANLVRGSAKVNRFMPAAAIPLLGWTARVTELVLGLALLPPFHGKLAQAVAQASAGPLALFVVALLVALDPAIEPEAA